MRLTKHIEAECREINTAITSVLVIIGAIIGIGTLVVFAIVAYAKGW